MQKIVLIIEDNPGVADMMVMLLDLIGYSAIVAINGSQAIDIIKRGEAIDLALVDLLPEIMKPAEVIAELKGKGIPFIITSSASQPVIDAYSEGASAKLRRPFDLKVIRSLIQNALQQ